MSDQAWIRVVLPDGWHDETWDMVMAASEMLHAAVHALDHKAQAEHLSDAEAADHFATERPNGRTA